MYDSIMAEETRSTIINIGKLSKNVSSLDMMSSPEFDQSIPSSTSLAFRPFSFISSLMYPIERFTP